MLLPKEAVLEKMKQAHVVFLNVLPVEEFQKFHIPGSHKQPLTGGQDTFDQSVENQNGKKRFFVMDGSNLTSRPAIGLAETLQNRGFNAKAYLSGLKEWSEAGLPTQGSQAPQPIGVFP